MHTPIPWTFTLGDGRNPYNGCIHAANGVLVMIRAVMNDEDLNVMETMVRAVNAHDDLMAALEDMLEVFGGHCHGDVPAEDNARAALAKARGE